MHIYFEDLIDECFHYASAMPETTDVYIGTNTLEKKALIEKKFSELRCNKVTVILNQNRGRDLATLLVAARPYVLDYDYVCYCHDKKVGQLTPGTKGSAFAYHCFENILHNRTFVSNILDTFEKNPRLGLLTPPPPYNAEFYSTIGMEWSINFEVVQEFLKEHQIEVPIRPDKEPISPLGSMFWFRAEAMRTLFEIEFDYTDFPPEPVGVDGTILHAIERSHALICQQNGYYPAWIFSDTAAKIEITNLYYMLRKINRVAADHCVMQPTHEMMCEKIGQMAEENAVLHYQIEMGEVPVKKAMKQSLKRRFPFLMKLKKKS